jgi:hypothetical protein
MTGLFYLSEPVFVTRFYTARSLTRTQLSCYCRLTVESGWNVMAHGDAGRGIEGETGEWSGQPVHCTLPRNMVYPALLPPMRTPRLPVVDWTDAPAELNGLVRFVERRNLVSARVPSHFKRSLLIHRHFYRTSFVDNEPYFTVSTSCKFKFFWSRGKFKQISQTLTKAYVSKCMDRKQCNNKLKVQSSLCKSWGQMEGKKYSSSNS